MAVSARTRAWAAGLLGLWLCLGGPVAFAQHHHHSSPAAPSESAAPSRALEMDGPPRRPETPADAALKGQFNVEYMLRAAQRPRVFRQFLPTLGAQGMLDVLERRNAFCHSEAHDLGRVVYEHFKELGPALIECGGRCTSGCTHGVLAQAFGTITLEDLRPRLAAVCTEGVIRETRQHGTCAHGIGHALMLIVKNDVAASIAACRAFDDPSLEYFCVTGAYMEFFDHAEQWAGTSASLYHPCDVYTDFPAACYRYQAVRMLRKLGGDRDRLAAACRSLPGAAQAGCFHGFGFAHYQRVAGNPALMAGLCPDVAGPNQTLCIEGVIENLAFFDSAKAAAACEHLRGPAADICAAAARGGLYRLAKPTLPLYLSRPARAD
jgi:hypothetical protein